MLIVGVDHLDVGRAAARSGRPRVRTVAVIDLIQKLVERHFNDRTCDIEAAPSCINRHAVVRAKGTGEVVGRLSEEEGVGGKVGAKVAREAKRESVIIAIVGGVVVPVIDVGGRGVISIVSLVIKSTRGWGGFASELGERGRVLVDSFHGGARISSVAMSCCTCRGARATDHSVLELLGGLEVRFLDWQVRHEIGGLVDGEGELHALYGAAVRGGFAVALLFLSALAKFFRSVVELKVGRLELLDAPAREEKERMATSVTRWLYAGLRGILATNVEHFEKF